MSIKPVNVTDKKVRDTSILAAAIKCGEAHLDDKINLLNVIEKALKQLRRGRVEQACVLLEQAVQKVGWGKLCVECEIYPADLPSDLCPGCEAYQEHQR